MVRSVGLAPYASKPEESRGRLHPEPEHSMRSPFQRDRDRIIHSTAFRRLTHKTQVFVYHEGDHYRTRLTHSLEVAQIARTISRALGLDEDLAETLALAHDLGHTPFGHAGEEALNAEMARFGGFSHNDQTLRILTRLERRYAEFDGLNLTWESLEGTVKHNGPLRGAGIERPVPPTIVEYDRLPPARTRELPQRRGAGRRARRRHRLQQPRYRRRLARRVVRGRRPRRRAAGRSGFHGVASRYPGIEEPRLIHEVDPPGDRSDGRRSDRRDTPAARREALGSADEVRALAAPLVDFSDEMRRNDRALKEFLFERMYRHHRVNRMGSKAHRVVHDLFALYLAEPQCLPREWRELAAGPDDPRTARVAADYLAGMTDRFALDEHHRLFDTYART